VGRNPGRAVQFAEKKCGRQESRARPPRPTDAPSRGAGPPTRSICSGRLLSRLRRSLQKGYAPPALPACPAARPGRKPPAEGRPRSRPDKSLPRLLAAAPNAHATARAASQRAADSSPAGRVIRDGEPPKAGELAHPRPTLRPTAAQALASTDLTIAHDAQ